MGLDFAFLPNLITANAPEYPNQISKATTGPEQRQNLSPLPALLSWTLKFSQETTAVRDAIKRHWNYHRGDWMSFDWMLISSYAELPNLLERYCPDGPGWAAQDGATCDVTEELLDPYGGYGATGIVSAPGTRGDTLRAVITPTAPPATLMREPTTYTLDVWVKAVTGSVQVYCDLLAQGQTVAAAAGWTQVTLSGSAGTPTYYLELRAAAAADTLDCAVYLPALSANRVHVRWDSLKITPQLPDLWQLECVFKEVRESVPDGPIFG